MKLKFLDKKGILGEGVLWFWRFALFILVFLVIGFITFSFSLDVRPVESIILAERASNCFSDSGVILISEFNEENLDRCYNFGESGMKLNLAYGETSKEIYSEQGSYLEPLCGIKGEAMPSCSKFRKNILVKFEETVVPASLEITTMLLNE